MKTQKKIDERKLLQQAIEVFLLQKDKEGDYAFCIVDVLCCLKNATKQLLKDNPNDREWIYPAAYSLLQNYQSD